MLSFQNLTLGYDRHPAVHHLSATIETGDFVALVGPNGAGKSTLMKAILGHIEPMEGRIELGDLNRDDIAYLPQASRVDRSFPLTVFQFAASGLWQTRGLIQRVNRADRQRVTDALSRVGLHGFEHRTLDALSGGQFQRLLFARKLVQNGRLLLLDEPFSGVDEQTTEDLMAVLQAQHRQGATIVAVIHNINLVRRYFPTSLLLSRELIAFGKTDEVLTTHHLNRASTIGFGDHVHADICQVSES
ncbi:metal ABC transporter ATP-binding protein [Reinekea blandensis]|uniref:ABC transporter, ATPase subunit n=1 Tax=Reinekea blandensis MED297 TaxID=314283 RepID=A4BDS6_9GAMM|nr:ABC transporter ATP-binding protein [Reinekea blandensis]EAR09685.1 ABC transporter, ATPase subunit [Reinekea blandensis MED297]